LVFRQTLKIQILDSRSQQKIVAFQSCVYSYAIVCTSLQMMWQGKRKFVSCMIEIHVFFVKLLVIILCPVFVQKNRKPKKPKQKPKTLKTFYKNLGFFSPGLVWESAAAWRCSTFISRTGWTLAAT